MLAESTKRERDEPDYLRLEGGDPAAARCLAAAGNEAENAKRRRLQTVPIIDLQPFLAEPFSEVDQAKVAAAIASACEEVGFFIVTGHQVILAQLRHCAAEAKAFFALPSTDKEAVAANGRAYGYFPMTSEALGYDADVAKRPDLREAFSMGPQEPLPPPGTPGAPVPSDVVDFCYQETPWPEEAGLKGAMTQCYEALSRLADQLLCIFAKVLKVDAEFFLSKTKHHASSLRTILYPKLLEPPRHGQLRCGAHSDICTITILWQDVHGGLEVLPRGCNDWMEVQCPEDGLIVNLGDLFARWTNDRWLSTPHRVVCPPMDDPKLNIPRISMPFFQILHADAEVACIDSCLANGEKPKHTPTTQGQDLMGHFKRWGRNRDG